MFGQSFYEAEAESHDAIQEEFSSQWIVRPMMKRANFSPQPDPNRPTYTIRGIFQWAPRNIMLGMEEAGFSTRDPKLTVMRCEIQGAIIAHDLFEYLCGGGADLSGGEKFEVTDIGPDGVSGVCFDLVQMGLQTGARG